MDLLEKIISWVKTNKGEHEQTLQLSADTELLQNGLIDSLDLLQLVAYIEEEFGLKLPPDALTPDNFSTPQSVSNLVGRLMADSH